MTRENTNVGCDNDIDEQMSTFSYVREREKEP
jgi:hypothetical protein